jgi:hypothetical protein
MPAENRSMKSVKQVVYLANCTVVDDKAGLCVL